METNLNDSVRLVLRQAKALVAKLEELLSHSRQDNELAAWISDGISMTVRYSEGLLEAAKNQEPRAVVFHASHLRSNGRYFGDARAVSRARRSHLPARAGAQKLILFIEFKLINEFDSSSLVNAREQLQSICCR